LIYLCIMNSGIKHFFQSFTLLSTLLFFVLFSNGLSFSLHYCDSCHQTKLFVFEHPNCCAESAHIHESEKECTDSHCDCCKPNKHHQHEKCNTNHHCCNTTHKYIRISNPFISCFHSSMIPNCTKLDILIEAFHETELKIAPHESSITDSPPIITKAGDSSFLNFVSQHILYA